MDDVKLTDTSGKPTLGAAFEMQPGKRYIIIFDKNTISKKTAYEQVAKALHSEGIMGICVLIDGNPKDVKIIEDNRKATEEKDAATT